MKFNNFVARVKQFLRAPEPRRIRAESRSQQILSFYMGKNTPARKDYIMENPVVWVECNCTHSMRPAHREIITDSESCSS